MNQQRNQLKKNNKEIRMFNFEVRAMEDERGAYLDGRPVVYEAPTDMGWYEETIERGALMDTDLKDVAFLVNHNTDMIPLARSRNNNANSTMQLTPDFEGLLTKMYIDVENNSDARNLYSAVKRGDIDGMSFMFVVEADRWEDIDTDYPKRFITKIRKIFEVSAVTFPAYEQTSIQARGLSEALDSAKESLESVRAEARELERRRKMVQILLEM
jgi:HK97 family phage prohead protease